jgi:hypothetical protein
MNALNALDPKATRVRPSPLLLFGLSIVGFFASVFVSTTVNSVLVQRAAFGGTALLALAGMILGVLSLLRGGSPGRMIATALFPVLGGLVMTGLGALIATMAGRSFGRGRQLRRLGKLQLPPVVEAAPWAGLAVQAEATEADREALAAQWRANGQTEHASVAAFAHLTLDLIALGAPPKLVIAAQEDALDEIRHTELCFSLARSIDGRVQSPGAFPAAQVRSGGRPRVIALAQLAVTSLVDGALNEGISARVLARLAKRCEVPAVRETLKEIARDEGRHSAHGWDVLEWCLAEGGGPVADALEGAIGALPLQIRSVRAPAAMRGEWERLGIHGDRLETDEFLKARADVVRRVEALIAPFG